MKTRLQLSGRRALLTGRRKTPFYNRNLHGPTSSSALTGQRVAQVQTNGTYTATTVWP